MCRHGIECSHSGGLVSTASTRRSSAVSCSAMTGSTSSLARLPSSSGTRRRSIRRSARQAPEDRLLGGAGKRKAGGLLGLGGVAFSPGGTCPG